MFEDLTLEKQRELETARGWKPTFSALTYCTAEAVVIHRPRGSSNFRQWEILVAKRTSGAPDCLGKTQGKWGTYTMPADRSPRHAMSRGLLGYFGQSFMGILYPAGIIGPWLHKAVVRDSEKLTMSILPEQGEATPFQATLFAFDATSRDIDLSSGHSKSTTDIRWVALDDLIKEQGENPDFLYWVMISEAFNALLTRNDCLRLRDYSPGDYAFLV